MFWRKVTIFFSFFLHVIFYFLKFAAVKFLNYYY